MRSSTSKATIAKEGNQLGWWRAWGATVVGGFLLAAGPTVTGFAYDEIKGAFEPGVHKDAIRDTWIAGALLALSVLATIVGAIIVGWQQHLSNRAARQSAADLTKYNDALSSLHKAVGRLLDSDLSESARREFFRSVVVTASQLFPFEGVRVCVYELDTADDDPDKDKEAQTALNYVDSGGRHDEPRKKFTNDSEYGRNAIAAALGTQHRCIVNADGRTDVDRPQGSTWQSFMQVPLRLNGKALGLLSVDTRDQVHFTKDHVTIARTAAALIVLGLKEVKRAADDFKPKLAETIARIKELKEAQSNAASIDTPASPRDTIKTNETEGGEHHA